ncbi:hypothetical protein B0H14DRAFT_3473833 [Mycena olivaceomarginata]|nr:hypothetical protein B0H14DRAFT_3473833 [Mycena olivaceomarginata]
MEWGVASICGRLAASCERDRRASVSVFAKATLGAISFLGRIGTSISSGGRVWLVHLTLGLAAAAANALALFSYFWEARVPRTLAPDAADPLCSVASSGHPPSSILHLSHLHPSRHVLTSSLFFLPEPPAVPALPRAKTLQLPRRLQRARAFSPDTDEAPSTGSRTARRCSQSQRSQPQLQAESPRQCTQYAHLPGASAPYTTEEATQDGHGYDDDDEGARGRIRIRVRSDDMIQGGDARGKSQPRAIVEDSAADGVLALLDAATNDLAQVITHEGTPMTLSPRTRTCHPESFTLRARNGSISSLHPYAARKASTAPQQMLGRQIAPRPTLRDASPPSVRMSSTSTNGTFKHLYRHTMTQTPEPEPTPAFHPLSLPPLAHPPAALRGHRQQDLGAAAPVDRPRLSVEDAATLRTRTGRLPPIFTRHSRNRSSLLPDAPSPKSSQSSARGMPLVRDANRILGMGGTMGGSDTSGYEVQELDTSDPLGYAGFTTARARPQGLDPPHSLCCVHMYTPAPDLLAHLLRYSTLPRPYSAPSSRKPFHVTTPAITQALRSSPTHTPLFLLPRL